MNNSYHADQIQVVDFPATSVATLEHRGDPRLIGDSVRRFIEWRKQNALPPRVSATFNILYDNPTTTPAEDFRLDLCASTQRDVPPNTAGIVGRVIPAGRCAVLRFEGSEDALGAALDWLYREWLPGSGEEPRDFPPYLQRISFFPDVPEHATVTDIYVPLR
jgi:AraC family transcriptional regulator